MALSTCHGSSVVLAPSPVLGFSLTCSETFSRAILKLVASLTDKHFQGFACLLYSLDPQGRAENKWLLGDRLLLLRPASCSCCAHTPSRKEAILRERRKEGGTTKGSPPRAFPLLDLGTQSRHDANAFLVRSL
ncbi:hypothetical protein AAC387_Pa03g1739 [Persea americana]